MSSASGFVSGPRVASRQEVDGRARRFASGLARFGVGPGDCVAILMRNDITFMEATYGTMMLGAYAVPLNWHFKPDEIAYVMGDSGAKVLVGHADLLHGSLSVVPDGVAVVSVSPPPEIRETYGLDPDACADPSGTIAVEPWLATQPPFDQTPALQPSSMIYTSGTTGQPKGVVRGTPTAAQHAAMETLRTLVYGVKPGARGLVPGPLYHSAPNNYAARCGRLGELLVLMPRFDAEPFLRLVEAHRIETVFMVPTMFVRLLALPAETRRRYDVSSLRHVIHAAAPCPAEVKRAMLDWWGPVIFEFYGGTETGPVSFATPEDARRKPGTVGRISPGAEVRILDEQGDQVERGEVGEIYSRIPGYPDFDYHNDPNKRASVERNGFVTGGDIGYLDEEGYLFVCDRKRDMVISGGVNIYPAEIEAVLIGLPGVKDCAVFGIPHPALGEALMAVVEPLPGTTPQVDALRLSLAGRLADFKVPRQIELRSELPREDTGKIFKRRLRDPYWEAAGRRI